MPCQFALEVNGKVERVCVATPTRAIAPVPPSTRFSAHPRGAATETRQPPEAFGRSNREGVAISAA